jgi:hypothetical protein
MDMSSTRLIATRMPQKAQAKGVSGETAFMLTLLSGVPHTDIERYLRHSPLLSKLADDLRSIERRLGTEDERPADLDQAQALGHQIRNLLCMTVLADEARALFGGATQSGTPFPACA